MEWYFTVLRKYAVLAGRALVHAGLDQHDEAFASLERAFDVHEHWLAFFLSFCPTLDDLRPDPRFTDLRRRIGL